MDWVRHDCRHHVVQHLLISGLSYVRVVAQTWSSIDTSCVSQSLQPSLQFMSEVVLSLIHFTSLHYHYSPLSSSSLDRLGLNHFTSLHYHCSPQRNSSLDVPSWGTGHRLRLNPFTSLHYHYSPQSNPCLDVPSWSTGHRLGLWGYEHQSLQSLQLTSLYC